MQEAAHFGLQLALKNVLNIDLRNRTRVIRQRFLNATLATGFPKSSLGLGSRVLSALAVPAACCTAANEKKNVFVLPLHGPDLELCPD